MFNTVLQAEPAYIFKILRLALAKAHAVACQAGAGAVVIGDAGDKITAETVTSNGRSYDFYAPANLNFILDNANAPDSLPEPNRTFTVDGFIGDHDNAELVAQIADALQIAGRRHQDAIGADNRLEDDGRDRLRPLGQDHLAQVRPAQQRGFAVAMAVHAGDGAAQVAELCCVDDLHRARRRHDLAAGRRPCRCWGPDQHWRVR